MTNKNTFIAIGTIIALLVVGYFFFYNNSFKMMSNTDLDATPKNTTLSGTFECLPHLDTTGPQTDECAFGLKTDDGVHYAVNFGAGADSMNQFQSGARITAEGFVVIKEALSSNQWAKYNMKGIFTITRMIDPAPTPTNQAKINIDVVCQQALAYMSFPDGKSAEAFVTDCKEGKHPEVIERYKAEMNLGAGAEI